VTEKNLLDWLSELGLVVECKLPDILGNIAVALLRSNESGNPFLGVEG
jgi:hypothetical protein